MTIPTMLYGENRWQKPVTYNTNDSTHPLAISRFEYIVGGGLGGVNVTDFNRLLHTVTHIAAAFHVNYGEQEIPPVIAIGVKHGNACGAAIGSDVEETLRRMISGDPEAILGGVVLSTVPINLVGANIFAEKGVLGGVLAPAFEAGAAERFNRKDGKCHVMRNPALRSVTKDSIDTTPIKYPLFGGEYFTQPNFTFVLNLGDNLIERHGVSSPINFSEQDMLLARAIGSTSNSNTITIVKNGMLLGNGVGQQTRVRACKLAVDIAREGGHDIDGAVAYSDSFFPFPDGPKILADAGVKAILSTSGARQDAAVIKFCKMREVALYLIPDNIGRGFFGHAV